MKIKDKTTFQSQGLYNLTAQIQENTVLNRGLLDLGGYVVPQMIMSNNKDEKIERGIMQGLYFVTSFLAPFVLLPFFNKTFLAKSGIINGLKNNERKIIEVSKEYLTGNADLMLTGIRKTAEDIEKEAEKKGKKISVNQDFENIISRFQNKEEELKSELIKTHEKVLFADFLATAWMWCASPWIAMTTTKLRTNRSGFSATYGMVDEKQSKLNAEAHEKTKKKKLLISAAVCTIPAFIFPKLITKGLQSDKGILSVVKKIPKSFNYSKGMFPSKAIFAAIWILCDYPASLISARDKYEVRDRAMRGLASLVVFFGGDFALNNIFGRLSDKFLHTEIMDRSKLKPKNQFFKKLLMSTKSFTEIEDLKNITPELLKKTKTIGATLYWITLVANMALCGFGLPVVLNKMLKNNIKKDIQAQNKAQVVFQIPENSKIFEKLN